MYTAMIATSRAEGELAAERSYQVRERGGGDPCLAWTRPIFQDHGRTTSSARRSAPPLWARGV